MSPELKSYAGAAFSNTVTSPVGERTTSTSGLRHVTHGGASPTGSGDGQRSRSVFFDFFFEGVEGVEGVRGAPDAGGGLIGALEDAFIAGGVPPLTGALEFGTVTMSMAMALLDVQPMSARTFGKSGLDDGWFRKSSDCFV